MWWTSTGTCFNGLYFFDKKAPGRGIESKIIPNKELAQELHKPIIRNFNKKSTLTFYWQYLWCRFSRHAINK